MKTKYYYNSEDLVGNDFLKNSFLFKYSKENIQLFKKDKIELDEIFLHQTCQCPIFTDIEITEDSEMIESKIKNVKLKGDKFNIWVFDYENNRFCSCFGSVKIEGNNFQLNVYTENKYRNLSFETAKEDYLFWKGKLNIECEDVSELLNDMPKSFNLKKTVNISLNEIQTVLFNDYKTKYDGIYEWKIKTKEYTLFITERYY